MLSLKRLLENEEVNGYKYVHNIMFEYVGWEDEFFEEYLITEFSQAMYKLYGIRPMFNGIMRHTPESYLNFMSHENYEGQPPSQQIVLDIEKSISDDMLHEAMNLVSQRANLYYNNGHIPLGVISYISYRMFLENEKNELCKIVNEWEYIP